jgi:hypothetical protein
MQFNTSTRTHSEAVPNGVLLTRENPQFRLEVRGRNAFGVILTRWVTQARFLNLGLRLSFLPFYLLIRTPIPPNY